MFTVLLSHVKQARSFKNQIFPISKYKSASMLKEKKFCSSNGMFCYIHYKVLNLRNKFNIEATILHR